MRIILCVLSVLFGGLSLVAAVSQLRNEKKSVPAMLMIGGSVLLIAAVICNIAGQRFDSLVALLGCGAICAAAIRNGLKSGQFHIQHHIVRIALSVLLIVGFFLL